ncbi:hypothetical protein [Psychroserpens sp.]|uniref:hypothetical protein n=1 Tax=Psychroserpens sp. TaxID=2020870 RepID=UPI001B2AB858|nr:hypothetical protein [Psychroserpens sp.]MBO6607760.1 hypothetical protein [Psychroserpens sp.]MBO6631007.1 hypothetical protein [Psychroserpens sp.]MBO6654751.1 hypothetical protein [Psychroserpens sp.]MBO6682825.1 hypothetical protein [Psychroserpens sp.]MBO6751118.1 hypothetical protein [Psychroserpens sp.]
MKKLVLTGLIASSLIFTGCFKDDDTPIIIEETTIINNNGGGGSDECPVVSVTGAITEDTTWTNDNIYQLNQKVVVDNGATLTIQEGTIIKGSPGTGSLASALIVARGSQINAVGTPSQPIIFTTTTDNITCGETAGTNLDENDRGRWGGLIILGNAPCSFSGEISEAQIEGIPADDTFGLYGGSDAADNSGVLQYVSIRHGGALIGEGNEINGLTLGGVGTGTTIDNIEIVANVDDGIEFFGGTVNATNLLVWGQGDDALDIDQAYSGTIDNAVVVLGEVSDHAFEIDGPEGSATGSFVLQNATIIGNQTTVNGEYADYRSNATGATNNIYAFGFKDTSDVELDNDGVATNYNNGDLTFGTWEIVLPAGVSDVLSIFKNNAETVTVTGFGSTASAINEGENTVGATTSALAWTYANIAGGLGF